MDRRLLRYYNRELQHLREMAGEFARENPKIAGRLVLDDQPCVDPYVERLLEGFAFLASRVQLKLDAEFPRFTQSLLETVYPHYLAPTPSMAIVQFQPDLREGSLAEGFSIPRGTSLRSMIGRGDQTACEYRTAHEVKLYPLRVVEAQYHTRDLPALGISSSTEARAAIRVRVECTGGLTLKEVKTDSLTFFLRGGDETPMRIYEQFFAHGTGVVLQPITKPAGWRHQIPGSGIRRVGFGDHESLLPYDARCFQGYRLIHEYFAFAARFLFVEIRGLAEGFDRCDGISQVDLIVLLKQPDLELENAVRAAHFELFCTPAINLFPKRADRIHISDRFAEFQVLPDRTRPLDFEVYQVQRVTGFGTRADEEVEFKPFYSATDFAATSGGGGGAYFATNRVPRTLSTREKQFGKRSASYAGSEVYLSLVDMSNAPFLADLRQLGVETLCTNRDLPLQMPIGRGPRDFVLDSSGAAPLEAIRCVGGPTAPKPSFAEGEFAWRLVSHLSLNYLSLTDSSQAEGASALRDLLRLYGEASDLTIAKQIDGVKSIGTRPITRRVTGPGPIAFARGLEVTVGFDETAFEGTRVFLLGAVLEQFFAKYVSLNSFTETVIRTQERGEVMRWVARPGQRQIL